jgi:hypothetical protein
MFLEASKKYDFIKISKNNNIENTVQVSIMLSIRLRELCESILSCRESYGVIVLYRAFMEHLLKHTYFFLYCIKKGDEAAKEYTSLSHITYEQLRKVQKAIWPNDLADYSSSSEFKQLKKDSDRTAAQFHFNKISEETLKLLTSKNNPEYDNEMIEKALRSMLVQYSMSSSYVHAGPTAVLNPETISRTDIDMDVKLFTIIAVNHIIGLLSLCPSEYQTELKSLTKEIRKNAEKGLAICEKNRVP